MEKNFKGQLNGIGGWMFVIIIFLAGLIIFNSYYFLYPRLVSIFKNIFLGVHISLGVPISAGILILYCISAFLTVLLIFMKKKIAIKISVITVILGFLFLIWFFLIGSLIYFPQKLVTILLFNYNPVLIILNLIFIISTFIYMLKSQRVRNTLIN